MANRKLQTEIDKVLKEVAKGVAAFEEVYQKIGQAPAAQKEKLEADLKKEIKKLQRFRDQIKTWIGSTEVKDKKPLTDNRRLIEMQMERFKACEKELKTKAFSKEGLLATQKLDPAERERMELADTLREVIEKLETQIDAFEFEVEKLKTSMGKKKDAAKTDKIARFEHGLERHKHHIKMIEIVLRLLENAEIEAEPVRTLIEDVSYYVDSNQEDDFEEDEGIYDDLNLGDAEEAFGINADDDSQSSEDEANKPSAKVDAKAADDLKKKAAKDKDDTPAQSPQKAGIKVVPAKAVVKEEAKTPVKANAKAIPAPPARMGSSDVPAVVTPLIPQGTVKYAAMAAAATASASPSPSVLAPATVPAPAKSAPPAAVMIAQKAVAAVEPRSEAVVAQRVPSPAIAAVPAPQTLALQNTSSPAILSAKPQQDVPAPQEPLDNRLPPALKDMVTSFVITKDRSASKTRDESILFNHMLETSFRHIPEPLDCERQKHYVPQNSYPTPSYYPQHPLAVFENPAVFEKFEIDTLFFIFYHLQGTYQQFLAARELKKQSWRFHKKFNTWFQRFEQPTAITDDYEQGAYVYFDYEGAWCQRKKVDFRFDYKWLEDESV
ncbi:Not1 N-terminal domain, CCR4-Not complex component-domain-containing protein [Chytriomyces sp. MP71]|nr:Not1 N-terminal domain, CCR4-Not complex component-domain-containing protein [Chytriomyces sp. MP71]